MIINSNTVPLCDVLERTTLNDLIGEKGKEIVMVKEDTKLGECIRILADNHILSLPVQAKDSIDILGFVDVLDILSFVIKTYSEGQNVEEAQWRYYISCWI